MIDECVGERTVTRIPTKDLSHTRENCPAVVAEIIWIREIDQDASRLANIVIFCVFCIAIDADRKNRIHVSTVCQLGKKR